jgi:hypothetical protein
MVSRELDEICDEYGRFDAELKLYFAYETFQEMAEAFGEIRGDARKGRAEAALLVLHASMAGGRPRRREREFLRRIMDGDLNYDHKGSADYVLGERQRLFDHRPILMSGYRMLLLSVCSLKGRITWRERKWLQEVLRLRVISYRAPYSPRPSAIIDGSQK